MNRHASVKLVEMMLIFIALTFGFYSKGLAHLNEAQIRKAIVKVFTVYQSYDYDSPWQTKSQDVVTGSGCIIEGERILTNAHMVSNSRFIQVRRADDPKKYKAEVEVVGHECDLALLRVGDPTFFKETQPLTLGSLPRLHDQVAVYGFPAGGEKISITQGIVSRIEIQQYVHSQRQLLAVQIDAAINPGNSGGPVLKDGRIVGVAFECLESGENIGYMVPTPVINHFLKDVQDGRYDGFPDDGIIAQGLESEALCRFLGFPLGQTGLLVNRVVYGSSSWGIVQPGDVILAVDDVPVANDGSIPFREGERIHVNFLVHKHFIGEKLKLKVMRQGKVIDLSIPLKEEVNLVPPNRYDVPPRYFIFGGLVFVPLTQDYVDKKHLYWYKSYLPTLFYYHYNGYPSQGRTEVVLLQKVLAHKINMGYQDLADRVVTGVNGKMISKLEDLVHAFEGHSGKYHVIETEEKDYIVLDAKAVRNSKSELLKLYSIPRGRSPDLLGEED